MGAQSKEVKSPRTQFQKGYRPKAPPCLSLTVPCLEVIRLWLPHNPKITWRTITVGPSATGPGDYVQKAEPVSRNKHPVPLHSLHQVSHLSSQQTNTELHNDRVEVCLVSCIDGLFSFQFPQESTNRERSVKSSRDFILGELFRISLQPVNTYFQLP